VRGYASVTGNGGHDSRWGFDAIWAANAPELQEDFGWRSNHVITLIAKVITAHYYGKPIKYSYMGGGSKGGQAVLIEAQRFPEDFDGLMPSAPVYDYTGRNTIAAAWFAQAITDGHSGSVLNADAAGAIHKSVLEHCGAQAGVDEGLVTDPPSCRAPANFLTHLQASSIWKAQAIRKNPGRLIPTSKLPLIRKAVVAACDARDGVNDDLLGDPRLCDFDLKTLECKGEDGPDCLIAAQVAVARAFYSPTVNPRTREQIYPGLMLGSELGWSSDVGRMHADITKTQASEYLRYGVFHDANWDFTTFDFDSAMAFADRVDDGVTKATDPNLRDFFQRGGTLLQYHG